MHLFSRFFSKKSLSPTKSLSITSPITNEDNNSKKIKEEYESCKGAFLEKIQDKMKEYWVLVESCKNDCESKIEDYDTKKQLVKMYETSAKGDFLSMCGRLYNEIDKCNKALKLQRTIQELFIMYKTDNSNNNDEEKQKVLELEKKFYNDTGTTIAKINKGGNRRSTKQKNKNKKRRSKTSKNRLQ
jgi:hypothetical protein